jgi:hypothetical protein
MLATLFSDRNSCCCIESRFGGVLIWTALVLSPNVTGFDDCLVIKAIILPNAPRSNGGFVIECHYNCK